MDSITLSVNSIGCESATDSNQYSLDQKSDARSHADNSLLTGGSKEEIRAGDVIWCPPGHKQWHGATSTTAMSHIAIQEALDGKVVDWLEQVADEHYQVALSAE